MLYDRGRAFIQRGVIRDARGAGDCVLFVHNYLETVSEDEGRGTAGTGAVAT